jgi:hypothetical protein
MLASSLHTLMHLCPCLLGQCTSYLASSYYIFCYHAHIWIYGLLPMRSKFRFQWASTYRRAIELASGFSMLSYQLMCLLPNYVLKRYQFTNLRRCLSTIVQFDSPSLSRLKCYSLCKNNSLALLRGYKRYRRKGASLRSPRKRTLLKALAKKNSSKSRSRNLIALAYWIIKQNGKNRFGVFRPYLLWPHCPHELDCRSHMPLRRGTWKWVQASSLGEVNMNLLI